MKCLKNLYEGNNIKIEKYIFNDQFSKILYNIPYEKDYIIHDYDCSNMSEELQRRLNLYGWNTSTVILKSDCSLFQNESCNESTKHMIVKVEKIYIKATTGKIINPDKYKLYNIT